MFDPSINISLYDHNMDLEEDMDWNYNELNFPLSEFYTSTTEQFDFGRSILDDEPLSPLNQIRNHDCMWSGRCTTHPNECLGSRSTCNTKYTNEQDQQSQKNTTVAGNNTQIANQNQAKLMNSVTANGQQMNFIQNKRQQNIPPGHSLLRLNQTKTNVIKLPTVSTNEFLKDREYIARPDTPLSLDDDTPEFKHSIDLAACTMGSNKMSLINQSQTEIINILKEHLQDENSSQIQMRNKLSNYMPSIIRNESIDDIYKDIKSFADFQENFHDDEDDMHSANENDETFNYSSNSSVSSSTTKYENTQSMHSDHSYTRSKSRVDIVGLGVQTPSDSGKYFLLFFVYLFLHHRLRFFC